MSTNERIGGSVQIGNKLNRFAATMNRTDITKGCKGKAAGLRGFAECHQLALEEISFMGDDVNDLAAMELAGLSAAAAPPPAKRPPS